MIFSSLKVNFIFPLKIIKFILIQKKNNIFILLLITIVEILV
jgi:hypothetical protein